MLKPVELVAVMTSDDVVTAYLYERTEKILLPIEVSNKDYTQTHSFEPCIYNTFKRTVLGLESDICAIKIYNYIDGIFYAYLSVSTPFYDDLNSVENVEISVNISDAIKLAQMFSAQIFVKNRVLINCGIKLTKKLIVEALKPNTNDVYLNYERPDSETNDPPNYEDIFGRSAHVHPKY